MFKTTTWHRGLTRETVNDEIIAEITRNFKPNIVNEINEFLPKIGFDCTVQELFYQAASNTSLVSGLITRFSNVQYMQTAEIQFHMRLLILQLATTTGQTMINQHILDFVRKCPGINDDIDYKYYIEDIYDPPIGRWRVTMKELCERYPELFEWKYHSDMFDFYTNPRYTVNEVAKTHVDLQSIDCNVIKPESLAEIARGFINMVSIARMAYQIAQ